MASHAHTLMLCLYTISIVASAELFGHRWGHQMRTCSAQPLKYAMRPIKCKCLATHTFQGQFQKSVILRPLQKSSDFIPLQSATSDQALPTAHPQNSLPLASLAEADRAAVMQPKSLAPSTTTSAADYQSNDNTIPACQTLPH